MNRKNFITSLIVGAGTGAFLSSCANENSQNKSDNQTTNNENMSNKATQTDELSTGLILHSVYFWLKEGITPEEDKDFLNFFEALRTIPSVKFLKVGKPAPTHQRDVVDNSFSYLLFVTFESMDDINNYEVHPDHLAAIDKYSKYWTKVQVKDAILI